MSMWLMGDAARPQPSRSRRRSRTRRYRAHGEFGSPAAYLWRHEPPPDARPATLDHATLTAVTASDEAKAVSKDLRRRGWAFVGPTTVYSAMEAMGLINDHLDGCFARAEVERDREAFTRPA
jgi:DNA-3-methyladenine glycosylase I